MKGYRLRIANHADITGAAVVWHATAWCEMGLDDAQRGGAFAGIDVLVGHCGLQSCWQVRPRHQIVDVRELGVATPGDLRGYLQHPVGAALEIGADHNIVRAGLHIGRPYQEVLHAFAERLAWPAATPFQEAHQRHEHQPQRYVRQPADEAGMLFASKRSRHRNIPARCYHTDGML